MLNKYVIDISASMGIKLSKISLTDGYQLGCNNVILLKITSYDLQVSALVFQSDLENLEIGVGCDRLEVHLRKALSRLQMKLEA